MNDLEPIFKSIFNAHFAGMGLEKPFPEQSPEVRQVAARCIEQCEAIIENDPVLRRMK